MAAGGGCGPIRESRGGRAEADGGARPSTGLVFEYGSDCLRIVGVLL